MKYTDYVDKELSVFEDTKNLYLFKKEILSQMAQRANEIIASGIDDEKVLNELVISEYKDIDKLYGKFISAKKEKKKSSANIKLIIAGILGFVLLLTIVFLCVSFATGAWAKTWVIMLFGLVAALVGISVAVSKKTEKKLGKNNIIVRAFAALDVFFVSAFLFCLLRFVFVYEKAWLVFVLAVVCALVTDIVLAIKNKEKTVLLNALIYIPAITSILYVLFSLLGVLLWHPGWLMIVFSVMVDMVIVIVKLIKNQKDDKVNLGDEKWSDD